VYNDPYQLRLLDEPIDKERPSVLKLVQGQPAKKYKQKKDWSNNPLQYETWTLDAQYCRDSKQNCDGCAINLRYGLKDECQMPESVKMLQKLENEGVKLHLQRDGALIIKRRKHSIYKHI